MFIRSDKLVGLQAGQFEQIKLRGIVAGEYNRSVLLGCPNILLKKDLNLKRVRNLG